MGIIIVAPTFLKNCIEAVTIPISLNVNAFCTAVLNIVYVIPEPRQRIVD
jgi:hypothetical protein